MNTLKLRHEPCKDKMEPVAESAAAATWITSKIVPTISGLFGGLTLAAFWTPEKLREKGKVAAVFIGGGVSVGASFAFTGMVADYLKITPGELDKIISLAYCLGFCSMAILNWVANFISSREKMDIMQVAEDVRHKTKAPAASRSRAPSKPATKPKPKPRQKRKAEK